jgi:hypothetical protein
MVGLMSISLPTARAANYAAEVRLDASRYKFISKASGGL